MVLIFVMKLLTKNKEKKNQDSSMYKKPYISE